MQLKDLLEMPTFINRELPIMDMEYTLLFYSSNTIQREFDVLGRRTIGDKEYWTILKKNKSFAVIGIVGVRREDGIGGLNIIGHVDFKTTIDLSWSKDIPIDNKNVLQVDGVQIIDKEKMKGFGYNLYSMIVDAGYVIISVTVQYIGGKSLWKRIAKHSNSNNYKVYIIDNGEVIMKDGKPLTYNGYNYPENLIWSDEHSSYNDSKKHVLFVLKKDWH
jgi:hypothetical protein